MEHRVHTREGYSRHSGNDSTVSSKASLYTEHLARVAALKAEANFLRQSRHVPGTELFEVEKELVKAEAVADVYAQAEDRYSSSRHSKVQAHNSKGVSNDNVVENSIFKLLQLQTAPTVEIDQFDGNPLEYNYFIATFQEAVESKIDDPRGRLTRLIKYTKGEAKELIKNCIQEEPATGYTHAMWLLKNQYGNPHFIARAYINELHNWEPLKAGDSKAFRELYGFLNKCKSCRSSGIYLKEMDSPDILQVLQSKLPYALQDKWNRRAVKLRTIDHREAKFNDFVELVYNEMMVVNDPMYSREAVMNNRNKPNDNNHNGNKITNNNSNKNNNKNSGGLSSFSVGVTSPRLPFGTELKETCAPCANCQLNHDLDDCPEFKKLSIKGRKAFLFKNRLCFGCYKATSATHKVQTCNAKRKCDVCNDLHPTLLHIFSEDVREPVDVVAVASTGCEIRDDRRGGNVLPTVSLCIVPVNIRHQSNPCVIMTVYAMLDNCSEGTFVTEEVTDMLRATLTSASISIKTISGTTNYNSSSTEGLQVSAVSVLGGRPPEYINLPKTYTR